MKRIFTEILLSAALAVALTGCSLLKFSLDTGDELPKSEARVRVMTRGLYYGLSNEVVAAADSIACSDDPKIRIRAIRWKIRATRAAVSAAMQGIPDVALADTWILFRRMESSFDAAPDSMLFGPYSDYAREAVRRMTLRVDSVAQDALDGERYRLMKEYVGRYIAENPLSEGEVPPNTTLAWIEFMNEHGVELSYATGSIADVVSDMSDRMTGQTGQAMNTLSWTKDIVEIEWERDSTAQAVQRQLDSLESNFERIVVVMENIPQISDTVLAVFNVHVETMMRTFERSLDNAFGQIDRQRNEIQRFVSAEREAAIEQGRGIADSVVAQVMDRVMASVGRIAVWAITLALIVLGLPFAAGYWVGTFRERLRGRERQAEK